MFQNMLKSFKQFLFYLLDYIAPERANAMLVKNIDFETLTELPQGNPVADMPWIRALFRYKNPTVKAIIWELKYRGNTAPLEDIGRLLYEEIVASTSDIVLFDSDASFLLIPIPISNLRRIERGYNQSEYICRAILPFDTSHILLYAPQWFEKIRDTVAQSHSTSKQERMKNLIDCFEASENVAGKYVILIDDVVTTGSTLSEARTTLLQAGARDVLAFTIAH